MSAKKFLALALSAYNAKQFEEAGILFAQAAVCDDAKELAEQLSLSEEETTETETENTCEKDADGNDIPKVEGDPKDALTVESSADDFEEDDVASVSSIVRRRTTSLYQIGKVLAASMSAADESLEEGDDEDTDDLSIDSEMEGELVIPGSFSSAVALKEVKSPIKLKD